MRLWLKDSERKPDPAPIVTDDRIAFVVGLALWVGALIALILIDAEPTWYLWTVVAGLVIGLLGILNRVRHRAKR
jgi:hypothetical protein